VNLLDHFHRHPSVSTDTRKISFGDIFFALKGDNFNGNTFAAKALEAGAARVVVDDEEYYKEDDERYILVDNVLKSLQQLGTQRRRELGVSMIGLTGSNGKTTTKELLASVLATEKKIFATRGNFNNHIGVPLTLLAIPEDCEWAIVEMGANQPGDIAELAAIAEPDMGLITNVGHAHLEKLGSLEGVRKTKGALFDFVGGRGGKIFVNQADPRVRQSAQPYGNQVSFGTEDSDYYFTWKEQSLLEMKLDIHARHWSDPLEIRSRLTGEYNGMNILSAVAVADTLGISREGIQAGIYQYLPQNNRSQVVQKRDHKVWLDAYNANPSSMKASIAHVLATEKGKIGLILGDMYELGEEEERLHAEIGEFLNGHQVDLLIGVGPRMKHMIQAYQGKNTYWFEKKEDLIPLLPSLLHGLDTILIKGSRSMSMEKILEDLP